MEEMRFFRMQLAEIARKLAARSDDPGYVDDLRQRFAIMSAHVCRAIEVSKGLPAPKPGQEVDSELAVAVCRGEVA